MDEFEQQAAREIANFELRRGKPYTAAKVRCSVFNDPANPDIFEWRMVDVTQEIRVEAGGIRDMKKRSFETLADQEIIDNIDQASDGHFVAFQKDGSVHVHSGGKSGKREEMLSIARLQLSQPEFLKNEYFDKNPSSGAAIDMLIALQWRYGAVYGVAQDAKGQQVWAHNLDTMLTQLNRLLGSI